MPLKADNIPQKKIEKIAERITNHRSKKENNGMFKASIFNLEE